MVINCLFVILAIIVEMPFLFKKNLYSTMVLCISV